MNDERIFAAALEKGDPALRREVEALLQSHQEAGSFLEQPVLGRPAGTADEADAGATRTELPSEGEERTLDFLGPPQKAGALGRLGHYEVLEVVGKGGMGIVLKAFDEALHRV